jgi:hypothetical protein
MPTAQSHVLILVYIHPEMVTDSQFQQHMTYSIYTSSHSLNNEHEYK